MAQGFDPAAATAAYLATLPPEAHAKAQAYTQGGHWLLLWGAVVGVAVAWLILRSGVLAKVRARVEAKGPRPWRAAAAVLAVYAVAEAVLGLPWAVYADWWRETQYGLTSQAFGGWLGEWGINLVISAILVTILLSLLYALIRRAPRTWWAWGGGLVAVFFVVLMVLAPVFIEPLFNSYKPAPAGAMRDAIVQMAEANGVPSDKIVIYDGSKQSNRYTANVSGLFGTARIAMSDVMFKQGADMAEVKAVVGHEMGHYVEGHVLVAAAAFGVLALVGFFLVDRLFPLAAGWMGARDVAGLSDPAGYPVIAALLAVLALLATPLIVSITRIDESRADQFSLERFNEPDGLARALVKTIEYRAATPSKLEETLFYDHPAVGNRVRRAMEWKATHPSSP
ncbi:MAG: M48 family metalloprotease [Phenylobacterium sp.]